MPDPDPDWFFQPRSQAAGTAEDAGDGLIRFPAGLLAAPASMGWPG
jgi:hypothetical protein